MTASNPESANPTRLTAARNLTKIERLDFIITFNWNQAAIADGRFLLLKTMSIKTDVQFKCDLCGFTSQQKAASIIPPAWVVVSYPDLNTRCDSIDYHLCVKCVQQVLSKSSPPVKQPAPPSYDP